MPDIDRMCLFHADRPQFDKLERELTDSNLLPRCNSHRLASAICSCNKEKGICFRHIVLPAHNLGQLSAAKLDGGPLLYANWTVNGGLLFQRTACVWWGGGGGHRR